MQINIDCRQRLPCPLSSFVYFIAILRGQAKPHRTTRLVFLVITTLTTLSHLHRAIRLPFGCQVFPRCNRWLFWFEHQIWHGWLVKTRYFCLLTALAGDCCVATNQEPFSSTLFCYWRWFYWNIANDYQDISFSEKQKSGHSIFSMFVQGICNVMATQNLVFDQYLYPVYIIAINLVMVFLVVRPSLARPKKS